MKTQRENVLYALDLDLHCQLPNAKLQIINLVLTLAHSESICRHKLRQGLFFPQRFPKRQILGPSKLKGFADENFRMDENGRKFSKPEENTVEKKKLLVTINFSFSHSVFIRFVLQTSKNQGLFGKGLRKENALGKTQCFQSSYFSTSKL